MENKSRELIGILNNLNGQLMKRQSNILFGFIYTHLCLLNSIITYIFNV